MSEEAEDLINRNRSSEIECDILRVIQTTISDTYEEIDNRYDHLDGKKEAIARGQLRYFDLEEALIDVLQDRQGVEVSTLQHTNSNYEYLVLTFNTFSPALELAIYSHHNEAGPKQGPSRNEFIAASAVPPSQQRMFDTCTFPLLDRPIRGFLIYELDDENPKLMGGCRISIPTQDNIAWYYDDIDLLDEHEEFVNTLRTAALEEESVESSSHRVGMRNTPIEEGQQE